MSQHSDPGSLNFLLIEVCKLHYSNSHKLLEEIGLYRYAEPRQGEEISNFTQYARALVSAFMQVQENQHLHGDDWQRTLYINTLDVKTTDFDLTDGQKAALIQEGIDGAERYLQWFEDPGEAPVNRMP